MFATLTLFLLMLTPPAVPQEQKFTPVEGATLQAKLDAAAARASTSGPQSPFWTAYAFDVRPGVATDFEWIGDDGIHLNIDGSSVLSFDTKYETRNLAVFQLRSNDGSNAITRLEVYNLARKREYGGYPVYWAGRASNDESLNFLRAIAESARSDDIASHATRALALHDDRRVPSMLETLARNLTATRVRAQAVRWLGHTTASAAGVPPLLLELARSADENIEIRRAAISALGQRRDPEVLTVLQSLFDAVTQRELKRTVLSAISRNENRSAAASFLVRVAERDPDLELRKRAVAQLGEIAGQQALGALADKINQHDTETELQKQAMAAIARRPASEAVPLLIKAARTHPKPELRKQAFLLLGRTGDPAAVSFLRETLLK